MQARLPGATLVPQTANPMTNGNIPATRAESRDITSEACATTGVARFSLKHSFSRQSTNWRGKLERRLAAAATCTLIVSAIILVTLGIPHVSSTTVIAVALLCGPALAAVALIATCSLVAARVPDA
jgi:hypothetical protein